MNRHRAKWMAIGALVLAALTVLWFKTRAVNPARHDAILGVMRHLSELDFALDEMALKARFGMIANYDEMSSAQNQIDLLRQELNRGAFPMSERAALDLQRAIDAFAAVAAEKCAKIEEFKSENATLRNSLQYFPVAIDHLSETIANERTSAVTADLADALLRDTLVFGLRGDSNLKTAIDADLTALERAPDMQAPPLKAAMATAAMHARSIGEHKSRADQLLAELLAMPSRQRSDELFKLYNTLYGHALEISDRYRILLYAICMMLAVYCGWAVWRIRHNAAALARANESLEQRVSQRTEELHAAMLAAKAATQSKSDFLANMSHEIRSPMTAILGYADLLSDPNQNHGDRADCVQTIRRNGAHLLSIINDILDISKIEAGKMTVEKIETSVTHLIADVASLMRGRALEKKLQFDVAYVGPIPRHIQTDPTRLRQILINLVGNAIKFTETGGVKITCELTTAGEHATARMRCRVTDTGIGLTREQCDRLFKPFEQADTSTTRKFGGTGLGLTISHRLAQMLGGDIVIESEIGRGSTFCLEIETGSLDGIEMIHPAREAGPISTTAADQLPRASAKALQGYRILLAEDGADNQRLISFVLKKAGAQVAIAGNGRIAVEMAMPVAESSETIPSQPFDVILMDMQMPEMDGYSAASLLRSRGYDGPIVALTAHAMTGDREKCVKAGCNDYAPKPIDREQLIQTILKHVAAATVAA